VLRYGEPAPVIVHVLVPAPAVRHLAPVAPAVATASVVVPIGRHRVTRERPLGTIIETLYQGTGAVAGQTYELYNAERPDEWVCYYRSNERCGAKTLGTL
jgi:hypothetical protein